LEVLSKWCRDPAEYIEEDVAISFSIKRIEEKDIPTLGVLCPDENQAIEVLLTMAGDVRFAEWGNG